MACSGNLVGWRWKLDAIERELNYDLVRLDKDKNNLNAFTNRLSQNAKILKALNKRNRERFYELLSEREKILRELQEKCGKGTKRQFEESDDDDE
jgi:endo-1,4-beta-D-glucanase Y